jgi:hypothetical protein
MEQRPTAIRLLLADSAARPMMELGPGSSGDDSLTARVRFHQSWWRAERLGVEYGVDDRGNSYGNYLTADDAERGLNFLTTAIHWTARERMDSGSGVEPFRCTRNLLSSQPMAFNLFGPLRADPTLAALLLDPLLPGGVTAASVHIEWAPPAREHLGDATSFDAVVRYTTKQGQPAIAAIETKLTEPFSRKAYGSISDPPHRDRYLAVGRRSAVWRDPEDPALADKRWNQVWRNHLLVESIRQHEPDLLGCAIVVHHPLDVRCATTCKAYTDFLVDPGSTFKAVPLDVLVATWSRLVEGHSARPWLADFRDRYLDLSLSETAWTTRGGRSG